MSLEGPFGQFRHLQREILLLVFSRALSQIFIFGFLRFERIEALKSSSRMWTFFRQGETCELANISAEKALTLIRHFFESTATSWNKESAFAPLPRNIVKRRPSFALILKCFGGFSTDVERKIEHRCLSKAQFSSMVSLRGLFVLFFSQSALEYEFLLFLHAELFLRLSSKDESCINATAFSLCHFTSLLSLSLSFSLSLFYLQSFFFEFPLKFSFCFRKGNRLRSGHPTGPKTGSFPTAKPSWQRGSVGQNSARFSLQLFGSESSFRVFCFLLQNFTCLCSCLWIKCGVLSRVGF